MSTDNFYLDAHGRAIEKYDEVEVPEPNETDAHNHSFTGMVDGFRNGYVEVSDMDFNVWMIEPERLEVLKADVQA